jgi:hypothetical protein
MTFKEELVYDLAALVHAWQDDAPDNNYYLDTRNGSVKLVHQNLYDLKQLTDEIEKHKERYLYSTKARAKPAQRRPARFSKSS